MFRQYLGNFIKGQATDLMEIKIMFTIAIHDNEVHCVL